MLIMQMLKVLAELGLVLSGVTGVMYGIYIVMQIITKNKGEKIKWIPKLCKIPRHPVKRLRGGARPNAIRPTSKSKVTTPIIRSDFDVEHVRTADGVVSRSSIRKQKVKNEQKFRELNKV